jgi:hypothetical protein
MKKNIALFFICALTLSIVSCGGGDDGGDDDSGTDADTQSVTTKLSTVDGYELVLDIASLDLDNDGYQDLLLFRTAESYAGLYIQALINNGDQTFSDQTDTYFPTLGDNYNWIEKAYLVDLNGDGLLDIVGHTDQVNTSSALAPLLRTDSGGFEICSNAVFTQNTGNMLPIDADADGDTDILLENISNLEDEENQVIQWTLLENKSETDGELTFESQGVVSNDDYEGWDYTYFVYAPVIIDIDNDGYEEFIYGGPAYQSGFVDITTPLSAYINSSTDSFSQSADQVFDGSVPSYTHVREMVAGDFNGDDYQDILVANHGYDTSFEGERNAVLINSGTGTFVEQQGDSDTHDYQGFTHSADVGDIDGDGDLDIVYDDICGEDVGGDEEIRILKNDGSGNFSFSQFYSDDNCPWTSTKLVDLDNDGYVDLVLGAMDSGGNSVVVWNNGAGEF